MSTNYEKFIAANQALMDCYAGVPAEQYSAMSAYDQSQVCQNEAATVASMIRGGHADFRNILAERIKAFDAPKE